MVSQHVPARSGRWPLALTVLLVGAPMSAAFTDAPRPGDRRPGDAHSVEEVDELRALVVALGLTGDPSAGRDLTSIDDPLAQLGKKLFFTKALGGDMDVACASCHLPVLAGGDALPLSIGVGADDPDRIGPGRTHPSGGPNVPRNSPTTFNTALWDRVLFHDGRVESLGGAPAAGGAGGDGIRTPDALHGVADPAAGSNLLAAQARFPVTAQREMRGEVLEAGASRDRVRARLVARIGGYGAGRSDLSRNDWPSEFEAVFGPTDRPNELITEHRIAEAIAAYEMSQTFIETPWKRYVDGDDGAIDDAAKRGALFFFRTNDEGGAGCAGCHAGDFFTDESFHVLAIPQLGPGKEVGATGTDDFGRFGATGDADDLYAFRTPSLINVEATAPYGHSGAYATLEAVVRHHLDPAAAVSAFDWAGVDPVLEPHFGQVNTLQALSRLRFNRERGFPSIQDVTLSDDQVADIVHYLRTLTDPCVLDAACIAPWMPQPDDADPDGLRLEAKVDPS